MVQLATQLVQRQSGKYDAADLEDRYETRLRAMIDAKLQGEGVDMAEVAETPGSNVVDLMAALKRSLGQTERPAAAASAPSPSVKAKATKPTSAKTPRKRAS